MPEHATTTELGPGIVEIWIGDASMPVSAVTFVCVSNRPDVLKEWLLAGLQLQRGRRCQLILVDAGRAGFTSAAAALHAGAARARPECIHLAFVHQDVRFIGADFVVRLEHELEALADSPIGTHSGYGVAGTAGVVGRARIGSIIQGTPPHQSPPGEPLATSSRVADAVDEHFFVARRDTYARISLDPVVCPHWDLYAVDLCHSVRAAGLQVFVLPLQLEHQSYGKLAWNYARTLELVRRKHARTFKTLYTCCGAWSGRMDGRAQFVLHKARSALRLALMKVGLQPKL